MSDLRTFSPLDLGESDDSERRFDALRRDLGRAKAARQRPRRLVVERPNQLLSLRKW